METAIRWSPSSSSTSPRFLFADVLNRSFNLGTLTSYHPSQTPKITYTYSPTYHSIPAFRALDWASYDERLLAVGTPSGETVALRLNDTDVTSTTFPAKYPRPCNAVAFSNEGKLAAGLERARNDHCLNLWDVQALGEEKGTDVQATRGSETYIEPLRKFASGEAVSSIKFFGSQPNVLVVGVKGVGIRCYDARDGAINPSLQFTTHCAHNIAIDPLNEVHFACAGPTGDTTIQVWDVRYGLSTNAANFAAGPNAGIAISGEKDGGVGPILSYTNIFNTMGDEDVKLTSANIWSLRYCKGKSGLLGALASNGDFRGFETRKLFVETLPENSVNKDDGSGDPHHDHIPQYGTRQVHYFKNPLNEEDRAKDGNLRVVSFDFTNLAGSKGEPTAVLLHSDRSVSIMEVQAHVPFVDLSSTGVLAWSKQITDPILSDALKPSTTITDIGFLTSESANDDFRSKQNHWKRIRQKGSTSGTDRAGGMKEANISSFERYRAMYGLSSGSPKLTAAEALSLANVARDRCANGYGLDTEKNMQIVDEDPWLQQLWKWIGRAKNQAATESSKSEQPNLSYLGIYSLWTEDLGNEIESRNFIGARSNMRDTIRHLSKSLKLPNSIPCKTSYLEHRQLCLRTLGLSMSEQELADTVIRLARSGEQTRGAALALMLGHHSLALTALKTGKLDANNRALALSVAAFANGTSADSWSDTVQSVLEDVTDPYARTIFSLVKHGNWRDVLKQSSLALRERVAVAVLHLSDAELTVFIKESTANAVERGDIEGIVLTGLTEKAVALLEIYINAVSDLQTVTLALCHTSPRFFRSPKVDVWRRVYRSWMTNWNLCIQRAQFDVACSHLASDGENKSMIENPPPQYTILCTFCEAKLDRSVPNMVDQNNDDATSSGFGTHSGSIFGGTKTGTSCLNCGRRMPRCVICLHWLGTPDINSKFGVKEAERRTRKQGFDQMTTFCRRCLHMFHVDHAEAWFSRHPSCPHPDCDCRCREASDEVYGSSPER